MQYNEFRCKILCIIHFLDGLLPVVFWILLIYGFDEPYEAGITFIAALIHECGHELFCLFRFGKFGTASGTFFGFKISKANTISYKEEALLHAAGPLANLLAAFVGLFTAEILGGYAITFSVVNFITGLSNLLPVRGHDGYGILYSLLSHFELGEGIMATLDGISFGINSVMCMISLYLMDRLNGGYWIFAIFLFSMLSAISTRLKYTNKENL